MSGGKNRAKATYMDAVEAARVDIALLVAFYPVGGTTVDESKDAPAVEVRRAYYRIPDVVRVSERPKSAMRPQQRWKEARTSSPLSARPCRRRRG